MLASVKYWAFCAVTGILVHYVPVIASHWWIRIPVWYLIVRYFKRSKFFFRQVEWECRYNNKETVIVTGASAGIGAETARQLTRKGAKVIWAARTTKKAQAVLDDIRWSVWHGPRGYVLPIDLADLESVRQFAEEFKKREGKLDCLILNAGFHGPKGVTKDGFERSFGVNHLGHMYLTHLLVDLLIETKRNNPESPARIVVVSSDLHRLCKEIRFNDLMFNEEGCYSMAGFVPYNHSKLANMLFARELAKRIEDSGVRVHAAHPGTPVQTELMRNNFLGSSLVQNFLLRPLYFLYCRQACDGAQTLIYTACSEECRNTNGKYFENCARATPSKAAQDDEAAKRLWDISCKMLKIKPNWPKIPE